MDASCDQKARNYRVILTAFPEKSLRSEKSGDFLLCLEEGVMMLLGKEVLCCEFGRILSYARNDKKEHFTKYHTPYKIPSFFAFFQKMIILTGLYSLRIFMSEYSHCCDENTFSQVKIDMPAPGFDLQAYDPIKDDVVNVASKNLRGKWTVLFFYPGDFTFVCPTELKDMADNKARFDEMGVTVLAASTDSAFSHKAWVQHEGLMKDFPYVMLSDRTLEISDAYNILNADGTSARGTFIIDPEGVCRGIEITSGPLGRNSEELIRKIEALQFMAANPGTACPAKWAVGAKTLNPSIKIAGKVAEELQ